LSGEAYNRFLAAIERHATLQVPAGQAIGDAPLADLGLDSMSTVGLLLDLEETFDLVFDERYLSAATFSTPRTLWEATAAMLAERAAS
jgi:acyl carrier protein